MLHMMNIGFYHTVQVFMYALIRNFRSYNASLACLSCRCALPEVKFILNNHARDEAVPRSLLKRVEIQVVPVSHA